MKTFLTNGIIPISGISILSSKQHFSSLRQLLSKHCLALQSWKTPKLEVHLRIGNQPLLFYEE
nr:MAG TPA: hypothetical protein [Caudoviricetes sp.]